MCKWTCACMLHVFDVDKMIVFWYVTYDLHNQSNQMNVSMLCDALEWRAWRCVNECLHACMHACMHVSYAQRCYNDGVLLRHFPSPWRKCTQDAWGVGEICLMSLDACMHVRFQCERVAKRVPTRIQLRIFRTQRTVFNAACTCECCKHTQPYWFYLIRHFGKV